jgi:hypothetical protein
MENLSKTIKKRSLTILILLFFIFNVYAQIDTNYYKLTDSEKRKIELEEKYRFEIQKKYSERNKSETIKFLNSPLGLWILSFVFISSISFLWNQQKQKREKGKAEKEKVKKLVIETKYRIKEFRREVFLLIEKGLNYGNWSLIFSPVLSKNYKSIFTEFENRQFESVLIESKFYSSSNMDSCFDEIQKEVSYLEVYNKDLDDIMYSIQKGADNIILQKFMKENIIKSLENIESYLYTIHLQLRGIIK